MLAKIKQENLNTKVYAALKQMITNYRFKPGERINVEQITKELGISRTPVWEAIRRLEHEGLVFNSPNKGVFMYTLSKEEALDLIAVRETLESMAARLVAERIDEKTLAKLDDALEKLKYDLFYIKNMSIPIDFMIILKTIKIVLQTSGAR